MPFYIKRVNGKLLKDAPLARVASSGTVEQSETWAETHHGGHRYVWYINAQFPSVGAAADAVLQLRRYFPRLRKLCVVNEHGDVLWSELDRDRVIGFAEEIKVTLSTSSITTPQEEQVSYEEKQPLHIERTNLIKTLQANLEAEQAKREEAQAKITARRQAAEEAIVTLSGDELVNLVARCGYGVDDIPDMVEEAKQSGRLVSPKLQETAKESELAKYVRVLQLATDKEIEVAPTSDLYALL